MRSAMRLVTLGIELAGVLPGYVLPTLTWPNQVFIWPLLMCGPPARAEVTLAATQL